ncbi:MAG TPA: ATP-binding protein, partial [Acidimicrobiales bacterium]|nr:ATP-binding protein [Acidimicrobiales bacterium]
ADVAASINVVQLRALDLAVEQAVQRRNFADTFLNLGRRVQGLVARQLDFITELEDAETDPETLADLFKLDHLATRIRRNAESLVVLAGVTRRQRRGEPVPVIDALRSALGEVDEYPRVDIGHVEPARLPMSIAADLAHILAELIENGLNFSPPESDVEIDGHHIEGGYQITVVDHGIGMSDDQIETANRRLSGNESFTVAPSRYMGHFVAGHLATGLGIDVQLASVPDEGTTATVVVPDDLLAHATTQHDAGQPETSGGEQAEQVPAVRAAFDAASFHPTAPPPAPMPAGQAESLSSLLSVHRRLSRPDTMADPDRSPWAGREDLPGVGAPDQADPDGPVEESDEPDADD